MNPMGLYCYCIIRCQQDRAFEVPAIGLSGGPVYTLCHQGLAVVVSGSPQERYESTRSHLLDHQQVQEKVMEEFTLLPMRFGTVADSPSPVEDIHQLLADRHQEFDRLLQEMEGRVELGLKAFWRDERAFFAELVRENPEIRLIQHFLAGKAAEATHYDRIHLGEVVKQALERKRAQEASRLLLPLRPLAYSLRENKTPGDRMVLNAAFLVDKSRTSHFDQTVNRLDEEQGRHLAFKYIGPVPPYNFVNITVNWKELG